MTEGQRPLGSGFGAATTAAEVLADVDLSGRTALVTGGGSGLGVEIVRALTAAGAHVLAPARSDLDLADQAGIAAYAEGLVASGVRLDLVIANAGVMACPEGRVGSGWELQLATNHLGHFALVNRVWPIVAAGARVVSVSSSGHRLSGIRWEDPFFVQGYDKWLAYGQSKTANVLFAVHLDRLARDRGIRTFSLHPGAILTSLGRHLGADDLDAVMTADEHGQPQLPEFKSPEAGAATAIWAATSPTLDGLGGLYCVDCDVAPVLDEGPGEHGVRTHALDPAEAARLWAWSAEQTGVDAFG